MNPSRSRTYALGGVLFAFVLLQGFGGGYARTQVVAGVSPFTVANSLREGVRVTQTKRGHCEPGSDVLPNNVYRCGYGNFIVDPCWRDRRFARPSVVCLVRP